MSVPCAHCGLPAPEPREGAEHSFCCPGCAAVWGALREAGVEGGFYALRSADEAQPGVPVEGVDAELDAAHFIEAHTKASADGSRCAELAVDGVHCAGCVWVVERLPYVFEGVAEASLDLPRARLRLRWFPERTPLSSVARWLGRFGYQVHPLRRDRLERRSVAERRLLLRVGAAWALAGNVMLLAVALYSGLSPESDPTLAGLAVWASMVLATVSVVYGGAEFFRRAWESVRALAGGRQGLRSLSIDTPIALGVGVGYVYSVWMAWSGSTEVWFDSLSVLIAALLTARWLQVRGHRIAGDAAERLLALIPPSAGRIGAEGVEERVPVEALVPGDRVRVRAGEPFPADGEVVSGRSAVNRAVLTGESRPEAIAEGSSVQAGSLNLSSIVELQVTAAGSASRVGRILGWLEERAARRAPIVQWADRISGVFIAAILASAVLTGLVWSFVEPGEAVAHAVALLVIACPCALGMATPLALAVAAGQAARRGVFIKHDDVLQALERANTVVLDKTGTLTQGRMALVRWMGDEAALRLAASVERESLHPVAAALRAAAGEAPEAEPGSVEEEGGRGLRGRVEGHVVCVGQPAWVLEQARHDAARHSLLDRVEGVAAEGLTPVLIAIDGVVAALACLGDPPRPEARALIEELGRGGHEIHVLSGDHPGAVGWLGAQLGLPASRLHGAVTPEAKVAFIEALVAEPGRTVVMVGDGVNDAAALQAAHVGVAVHGSAEASVIGADIFLSRPGLEPVLALLRGARLTMRTVRRNLAVSLLYNALGVTAAALGLVNPLAAAIAMPLSSLFVVASSLMQRPFAAELSELRRATDPAAAAGGRGDENTEQKTEQKYALESV